MPNNSIAIDKAQFDSLLQRLDAIIRLIALTLPKDMTQKQKVEILDQMGLSDKVIASVLGTTDATVHSALTKMRRKAKVIP